MIEWFTPRRALYAAIALAILLAGLWLAGRYHQGKLSDLKTDNTRITDALNQKLGEAHANELAAREEAMQARALVEAVEAGNRNVKALEVKLEGVKGKYEEAKTNMGGCADTAECERLLCLELRAANFKVTCPD